MHAPVLTRLAALLAPALLASVLLSGCNETTPAAQAAPKKPLSIGIVQIVEHEALDDAVKGFVERLDELGYREGVEVTLDRQNAQGDQATLAAITGRVRLERRRPHLRRLHARRAGRGARHTHDSDRRHGRDELRARQSREDERTSGR